MPIISHLNQINNLPIYHKAIGSIYHDVWMFFVEIDLMQVDKVFCCSPSVLKSLQSSLDRLIDLPFVVRS